MGTDTRIAVSVFLFYLLYGVVSWSDNGVFIPPVIFEPWLLGLVSLAYFVMSVRSWFSVLHLLFLSGFIIAAVSAIHPYTRQTALQNWSLLVPLVGILVIYLHTAYYYETETRSMKIAWGFHLAFFLVSTWPVFFENGAVISLAAGLAQNLVAIRMLSIPGSSLLQCHWKKRALLILMLIVFFDVADYIFYLTLQPA